MKKVVKFKSLFNRSRSVAGFAVKLSFNRNSQLHYDMEVWGLTSNTEMESNQT